MYHFHFDVVLTIATSHHRLQYPKYRPGKPTRTLSLLISRLDDSHYDTRSSPIVLTLSFDVHCDVTID